MADLSHDLVDQTRGLVVAVSAAMGVDQSIGLLAQAVPSINDAFLMQLAEKGGGWVVLLIVLFFYRRDYHRLTVSESELRKEALAAGSKQADAELKLAVALTQNTEIVRQLLANQNGEYYGEDRREAERREAERRHDERRRT